MNIPLKTKVKYWYYFLRLCHLSEDPVIQTNLKKSESFYKQWGHYKTGSYENWWKTHSHLFRVRSVLCKLTESEPLESNHLYIKIPLTYSPTTVSKIVKSIYAEEQNKNLKKDGKVKKIYGGSYSLSSNDLQTSHFDYYLRFTKEVYLPLTSQGIKGTKKFKEKSIEVFRQQKVKSSRIKNKIKRVVPFRELERSKLDKLTEEDLRRISENLDRLTRRYKTYSEKILLNVSNGVFPGDYEEVGIKNQVEKRKTEYKIRKFSKGPSKTRIHKKSGLVQDSLWIDGRKK